MRGVTNAGKVEQVMRAFGESGIGAGRIYFTGGATAVLCGWRDTTVDMDLKLDPEPAGVFESLPALKEECDINIELAAPDQFIPEVPGWKDRSQFIAKHGRVEFYHYDFYSQALAKLERDHDRDAADVAAMLDRGLIEKKKLWELFLEIESKLKRFPAIDPPTFRERVARLTGASLAD